MAMAMMMAGVLWPDTMRKDRPHARPRSHSGSDDLRGRCVSLTVPMVVMLRGWLAGAPWYAGPVKGRVDYQLIALGAPAREATPASANEALLISLVS